MKNTYLSNYLNTIKIIDNLKKKDVERYIYTSSCSVYGVQEKINKENSKVKPISLYADLKIKCEKYILKKSSNKFTPVILRLATVFDTHPGKD